MATNVYPTLLPRMNLVKRQQTNFGVRYADVYAGPPFSELLTEDNPTTWSGQVRMKQGQGAYFLAWLNQVPSDNSDLAPRFGGKFNMDIRTEFGLQTQEVQFLEMPDPTTENNSDYVSYNFTILTRAIAYGVDIANDGADVDDIITEAQDAGGDYLKALKDMDVVANAGDDYWP